MTDLREGAAGARVTGEPGAAQEGQGTTGAALAQAPLPLEPQAGVPPADVTTTGQALPLALEMPAPARADGAAGAPDAPLPQLQVQAGVVLPEVPHAVQSAPLAQPASTQASTQASAQAAAPGAGAAPAPALAPLAARAQAGAADGAVDGAVAGGVVTDGVAVDGIAATGAVANGSAADGDASATPAGSPYAQPQARLRPAAPEAEPPTALFWLGLVLSMVPAALLFRDTAAEPRVIGEIVGGMLFVAAFFCGLSWLLMRKRSARAQGIAMLFAGLIAAGASTAQLTERLGDATNTRVAMLHLRAAFEEARAVDAGAVELPPRKELPEVPQAYRRGTAAYFLALADAVTANSRRGLSLNRRMAALDFSQVLSPAQLSSLAALRRSRALVGEFRAVVQARDAAGREALATMTSIIEKADISEQVRAAERRVLAERSGESQRELAEVTRANIASVEAIDRALQLIERNLGRGVNVTGGRLVFNTQPLLEEYRNKVAEVRRAATEEDAVVARVTQARQQRMQVISDKFKGAAR